MEIIQKDNKTFMKVEYESPLESEGTKTWLFKELMMGDFMSLDVTAKLVEGKTLLAQHTAPVMFMLNSMMIEGEKITDETPYRIFGHLKKELDDFLA